VISLTQRPLADNTQHSKKTNIHESGGVWTRNNSQRVALNRAATGIGRFLNMPKKNWKINANTFNVQMPWRLLRFLWRYDGHAVASGVSNCWIPNRRVLTLIDQTLRDTGTPPGVRNVDKQKVIVEMVENSPRGSKRTILDAVYSIFRATV